MTNGILNYTFIKELMLKSWRKNDKWVLFPANNKLISADELRFVGNIHEAHHFCETQIVKGRYWQYKPLVDLLRFLNEVNLKNCQSNQIFQHLELQLTQYPIEEIYPGTFAKALCSGEICVGFWKKTINVLSQIFCYHVIIVFSNYTGNHIKQKFLMSCVTFHEAMKFFHTEPYSYKDYNQSTNLVFLLVGQIKKELLLTKKGMPLDNSGIVLYRSSLQNDILYKANALNTVQLTDITSTLTLKIAVLFKFSTTKLKLEFLDGKLSKIYPGTQVDYLDVKYFECANAHSLINRFKKD